MVMKRPRRRKREARSYLRAVAVRADGDTRARNVRMLAAGGTISMTGEQGATPGLDADALVASIPSLAAYDGLEVETISNVPSTHLTLDDQLRICRAARDVARRGIGVVVTHGTDTLEETAMLCDVVHDAEAPIVFTGAIRPATAPGADGPANAVDAVSVAASEAAAGMGVLVCFGGEIHHARCARKTDTTSLVAFSSPQTGPLGRVTEGHPDDLVADTAKPAARPSPPQRSRLRRSDRRRRRRHPGAGGARHRSRRRRHRARSAPGTWRRRCSSSGPTPPSGSR